MSITINLSDETEAALRAEAENLQRPADLFLTELLEQRYAATPPRHGDNEAVSYSDADDLALAEGIAAVDAGHVRSVQSAFAAFAERHNAPGATLA